MVDIPLSCSCRKVQGVASGITAGSGTRLVCYCADCQAFARYLEGETEVLDNHGGTDIYQLAPAQVTITEGVEHLRCMRLTQKGLHRWYTDCCNTPVENTVSASIPLVGLVHNFMDDKGVRDSQLGPVLFHVQGKTAKGVPSGKKVHNGFPFLMLMRTLSKLLWIKLSGRGQPSAFYNNSGEPIVEPHLVNTEKQTQKAEHTER